MAEWKFTKAPIAVPFAAEETEPYIFTSYAHGDTDRVFPLIKGLYEKGWHVWYDQGIEINTNYHEVIANHIKGCEIVVMFVTHTSVAREYVIDVEIAYALELGKKIVFCALDSDAKIPEKVLVRTTDSRRYPRTDAKNLQSVLAQTDGLTRTEERRAYRLTLTVPTEGKVEVTSQDDEYEHQYIEGGVRLTKYRGNLTEIILPKIWKGQPVIELYETFTDNGSIKSVVIPEGVVSIGDRAFADCAALEEVTIPNGVEAIGESAFFGCKALTEVNIPDGVRSIGEGAFEGCDELEAVYITDSVEEIGDWAFTGCESVEIVCPEDSAAWEFAEDNDIDVCADDSERKTKKNRTKIPFKSDSETPFAYCSYAHEDRDIVFPIMTRLHNMGYSLRYDELCRSSAECAEDIRGCARFLAFLTPAYMSSAAISELRLAETEKRVLYWLSRCDLPEDIAQQQDSIQGLCAWSYSSEDILVMLAKELDKGKCRGRFKPVIPDFDFSITVEGITLTKYMGSGGDVEILPEYFGKKVTALGEMLFDECEALTYVRIPETVRSIGEYAFSGCRNLEEAEIPHGVERIERNTFANCRRLRKITLPDSVTYIGKSAFSACDALFEIAIPGSVKSIEPWAFSACSALKSVTVPEGVGSVGENAFAGCKALTEVTLPDSVTYIGKELFSLGCGEVTVCCRESSHAWRWCEENGIMRKPAAAKRGLLGIFGKKGK